MSQERAQAIIDACNAFDVDAWGESITDAELQKLQQKNANLQQGCSTPDADVQQHPSKQEKHVSDDSVRAEAPKPQPPAEPVQAPSAISHDMAVIEAAQDLIVATVGVDLDALKELAPTIDKLIAARRLGLGVSLHVTGGEVAL